MTIASPRRVTWVPALALAILVIAIWLPFRLPIGGAIEEWYWINWLDSGQLKPFEIVMERHALRPLNALNLWVPLVLTPGSFWGMNFAYMLLFWTKAILVYGIARLLNVPRSMALLFGALFIIYPADESLMAMRVILGHTALVTYLLAVIFLLRWRMLGGVVAPTLVVVNLFLTFFNYESTLALALLTPVILMLVNRKPDRQLITILAVWYVVVVGSGLRIVLGLNDEVTYQHDISDDRSLVQWLLESPPYLLRAYQRTLTLGWGEAVASVRDLTSGFVVMALMVAGVIAGSVWTLWQPPPFKSWRVWVMIAVIGLVIIGAGYAMFVVTVLRTYTERTYYVSSLGGALLVMALLWWFSQRTRNGRVVFTVGSALLTFVMMANILLQQQYYAEVSNREQAAVASVAATLPGVAEETRLVLLIDSTGYLIGGQGEQRTFYDSNYLTMIFATVGYYGEVPVEVCQDFSVAADERCDFRRDALTITQSDTVQTIPYDRMIVLWYRRDRSVQLMESLPRWMTDSVEVTGYDPHVLICPDCPAGNDRFETLIRVRPVIFATMMIDGVYVEFEDDFEGVGWGRAITSKESGMTYHYMVNDLATVELPLSPQDYILTLRIANDWTPELRASLRAYVNGRPIYFELVSSDVVRATIPSHYLTGSFSTLLFEVDAHELANLQGERGSIGLAFDWLEVIPTG